MNEFEKLNDELVQKAHSLQECLQTYPYPVKARGITTDYWKQFRLLRSHLLECQQAMDELEASVINGMNARKNR